MLGRLLSSAGASGESLGHGRRVFKIVAEAIALLTIGTAACDVVDRLLPDHVVDLRQKPFAAIVEQRRSQAVEYDSLMRDGDGVSQERLSKITKKPTGRIADEDMDTLLLNLLGESEREEGTDDANLHGEEEEDDNDDLHSSWGGGRHNKAKTSREFQEKYRVVSSDERAAALKSIATRSQERESSSLTVKILSLAAAKQSIMIDSVHMRFMQLEDFLEFALESRLADTISPKDSHMRYVVTQLGQLSAVALTACAAHKLWGRNASGSPAGYNSSGAMSKTMGLVNVYEQYVRWLSELHTRPSSSAALRQLRKWRLYEASNHRWVPFAVLGICAFAMFNSSEGLAALPLVLPPSQGADADADEAVGLLALPFHRQLQQQLKPGLVNETLPAWLADVFEPHEDEQMVLSPSVWQGATREDPFHRHRLSIELIESPVLENALYRGIVFNRLLGHATAVAGSVTGPTGLLFRGLAHVLSAAVAALPPTQPLSLAQAAQVPMPERHLIAGGFTWALFMQHVYRSTGSLLLATMLSSCFNAWCLSYEYSARDDFVKRSSSAYTQFKKLHVAWFQAFLPIDDGNGNGNGGGSDGGGGVGASWLDTFASPVYWALRVNSVVPSDWNQVPSWLRGWVGAGEGPVASSVWLDDITPVQIRALAKRVVEVFATSEGDDKAEPKLGVTDIVDLLVALEQAVAMADTRPFRGVESNLTAIEDWSGDNLLLRRLLLDAMLQRQRPALREAVGAQAFHTRQVHLPPHIQTQGEQLPQSAGLPKGRAHAACLDHLLASQAENEAFRLDVKLEAVASRFPHGLTEKGVESLLTHALRRGFCGTVRIDYAAFQAALFRWHDEPANSSSSPSSSSEAFLDLIDGYWRTVNAAQEGAVQRFLRAHAFVSFVELAGRATMSQEELRAVDNRMLRFVGAACEQEAALFLTSAGLGPARFGRLLRRQCSRAPECAKLDAEWRGFVEARLSVGRLAPRFAAKLDELHRQRIKLRRPVAEEVVLRR